jgi:hypothetical protein
MRIYDIAIYFALVGVVAGCVDYMMFDAGGDDWFDQHTNDMQLVDISEGDVEALNFADDGGILDDIGSLSKYTSIFWKVLQGVFLIATMLDDFMVYDVGGVNLFAPVLAAFQLIIWVLYIVGGAQFVLNRSIKGME